MDDAIPQGRAGELERGHESIQIGLWGLLIFTAALIGMVLVVLIVLRLCMESLQGREQRVDALYPGRLAIEVDQFPKPRLQQDPRSDLAEVREEEIRRINSYEWIDRKAGIARIPVDRAMDILARKGLPRVPAPAPVPGAPAHTSIPPAGKRDASGPGTDSTSRAKKDEPRPESQRGGKP